MLAHGHIILIPSKPVFALAPYCCVLSGEATNTNFIVFGLLTRPELEPTVYRTQGKHANHYTTDVDRRNRISDYIMLLDSDLILDSVLGFLTQMSTIFQERDLNSQL